MKYFVLQWWLTAFFGAIASLFGMLLRLQKKKLDAYREEQKAIKLGIQALLRDRIQEVYLKYTKLGYIPIYARENLNELSKQYYGLGGNGVIHDLMKKLSELPTENPNGKEK